VRLIRLAEGERLVGIERVDESFEGEGGGEGAEGAEAAEPAPEDGAPSA
jgi:hypothetical protein